MTVTADREARLIPHLRRALPELLPDFLLNQRWFGGKARAVRSVEVVEIVPVRIPRLAAFVILVRVEYSEGIAQSYALPLALASPEREGQLRGEGRSALVLRVPDECRGEDVVLFDALWDQDFSTLLLDAVAQRLAFRGAAGEIAGSPTRAFARLRGDASLPLKSSVMRAEQSNTSVVYEDRLILKLFRGLQAGVNPEVEIGTFLTERTSFGHIPAMAGTLLYRRDGGESMSLAIVQAFVSNRGDSWNYTLEALDGYLERVGRRSDRAPLPGKPLLASVNEDFPSPASRLIGAYFDSARLLGERTAQLHLALASDPEDTSFSPESFSESYQRSLYHFMSSLAGDVFRLLRGRLGELPAEARETAEDVLKLEPDVHERFRSLLRRKMTAMRIRIHGDYHLGQVLFTGEDFVIIDFEGEPALSITDRRSKRSALHDVAGMLRSFHYAAYTALTRRASIADTPSEAAALESWARYWQLWVSSAFMHGYLRIAGPTALLPRGREELETLLQIYLLEKAVYELGYDLNNRPDWVKIPLHGILQASGHERDARRSTS